MMPAGTRERGLESIIARHRVNVGCIHKKLIKHMSYATKLLCGQELTARRTTSIWFWRFRQNIQSQKLLGF